MEDFSIEIPDFEEEVPGLPVFNPNGGAASSFGGASKLNHNRGGSSGSDFQFPQFGGSGLPQPSSNKPFAIPGGGGGGSSRPFGGISNGLEDIASRRKPSTPAVVSAPLFGVSHSRSKSQASIKGQDPLHGAKLPPMPHKETLSNSAASDTSSLAIGMGLTEVMDRFIGRAESKVSEMLGKPQNQELDLRDFLGPKKDTQFDSLIESLAQIARVSPRPVIEGLISWRKKMNEAYDIQSMQNSISTAPNPAMARQMADVLSERRTVSSLFILCRALTSVGDTISRESLGEEMGQKLERLIFNLIKGANPAVLARSQNRQINQNGFSKLLGKLSKTRFQSVSDLFRAELKQVPKGVATKEGESKYEMIIQAMRFLEIKTYPMEDFEEAIEFMQAIASTLDASHGYRIKAAFAESIVVLLAPVITTATAEVNHPGWAKATQTIYDKGLSMLAKPRYFLSACLLVCSVVSAAPQEFLLANLSGMLDMCLSKYKEKGMRPIAFYGILQLLWAYLHRCQESSQAITKRLDPIIKASFPPNRTSVAPADVHPDYLACVPCYIATRQFDQGSEVILNLLPSPNERLEHIPCERASVAMKATMLTLDAMERGENAKLPPPPPTTRLDSEADFKPEGGPLPAHVTSRASVRTFVERCSVAILRLAIACDKAFDQLTVFEDRSVLINGVSALYQNPAESQLYATRRNGFFTVIYPKDKQPLFDLFRTCFTSWPRCLADKANEPQAINILLRALVHVDPDVNSAARSALERMAKAGKARVVADAFTHFVVQPDFAFRDNPVLQTASVVKLEKMVKSWIEILMIWVEHRRTVNASAPEPAARRARPGAADEDPDASYDADCEPAPRTIIAIEAAALVFISSPSVGLRRCGVAGLRMALQLSENDPASPQRLLRVMESKSTLIDEMADDLFSSSERPRLGKWRKSKKTDLLLRLIESDSPADYSIWLAAIGQVFQSSLQVAPAQISMARSLFQARFAKIQPAASSAASLHSGRSTPAPTVNGRGTQPSNLDSPFLVENWRSCLNVLCSISIAGAPPGDNAERGPSQDQIIRSIMPFLASDHTTFREAAVRAFSSVHPSLYRPLLENMQAIVGQFRADRMAGIMPGRPSAPRRGQVARIRLAIARVHELTSWVIGLPDYDVSDNLVGLLSEYLRETFDFLKDKNLPEDTTTLGVRRSFCIGLRAIFECKSAQSRIPAWLARDVKPELFSLLESWTFRSPSGTNASPMMRNGRFDTTTKSRSSSISSHPLSPEILIPPVAAMAAICNSGASPVGPTAPGMPIGRGPPDYYALLRWIKNVLDSGNPKTFGFARRALEGIFVQNTDNQALFDAVIFHCFGEADTLPVGQTCFSVLSDLVLADRVPTVSTLASFRVLVMYKIGHADVSSRFRGFEVIAKKFVPGSDLSPFLSSECGLHSSFAGVASSVQLHVCSTLAERCKRQAYDIALELAIRAMQTNTARPRSMLRLMPAWLSVVDLVPNIGSGTPTTTDPLLARLFLLTVKFGDNCYAEVRDIWCALVSQRSPALNQGAIIKFLVEETMRRGNLEFLRGARKIMASLTFNDRGLLLLREMAELVEPSGMVAPADAPDGINPTFLPPSTSRRTDLDSQFPIAPKRNLLSVAQATTLLAIDGIVQQAHVAEKYVPLYLHGILMHVDHYNRESFLRVQSRDSVLHLMTILHRSTQFLAQKGTGIGTGSGESPSISDMQWRWRRFWEHGETSLKSLNRVPSNMELFVEDVVNLFSRRMPDIRKCWGAIALDWAAGCPVRHIACRSLQAFRILAPPVNHRMVNGMIARLSNTAGDPSSDIQVFARELLFTLSSISRYLDSAQLEGLPQIFWATFTALETPNEVEFQEACIILHALLDKVDLSQPEVAGALEGSRPAHWEGMVTEQIVRHAVLKGLRSATTCKVAWDLVRMILKHHVGLADYEPGTVAPFFPYVYCGAIPWAMQGLEDGTINEDLSVLATDIATLADAEEMPGISRVMTSFVKRRFRTKDDFVRQAVGCIREYFSPFIGEIFVLYVGLLNSSLGWLRVRTLALLKVFTRLVDVTQSVPAASLGTDLLTPLIRLSTLSDIGAAALEVLEEKLPVPPPPGGQSNEPIIFTFGQPADSGWCIPNAEESSMATRKGLKEVLDACRSMDSESRPATPVEFASEDYLEDRLHGDNKTQSDFGGSSSLGDMVSTLHELSSFFEDDDLAGVGNRFSQGLGPASKVAAILSRGVKRVKGTGQPTRRPFSPRHAWPDGSFASEPTIDEEESSSSEGGHWEPEEDGDIESNETHEHSLHHIDNRAAVLEKWDQDHDGFGDGDQSVDAVSLNEDSTEEEFMDPDASDSPSNRFPTFRFRAKKPNGR